MSLLVKNQYFGDTRDLFKFDLVLELLSRTGLRCFTFIPMLTPDDGTTHGSRTDYEKAKAGRDNKVLCDHLRSCVQSGRRDVRETLGIFQLQKYERYRVQIWGETFRDEARFQYFGAIPKKSLKEAVIVLDPDIGLWVRTSRLQGERYLRYDEARYLFDTMDGRSVLVIFQYIPRTNRISFFNDISMKLKEWVTHGRPPLYVSDNQVAFFVLTKDNTTFKLAREALKDYSDWYDLIFGES